MGFFICVDDSAQQRAYQPLPTTIPCGVFCADVCTSLYYLVNPMPTAAPRPCTFPACRALVNDGSGRCAAHPKPVWGKRPDATKRITGRRLQAMRAELFTVNPLCAECERQGLARPAVQRDHIVPLEEGGADDPSNVQGLCLDCHDAKSKIEAARGRARARPAPSRGRPRPK